MLVFAPPRMVPALMVGEPRTGWRLCGEPRGDFVADAVRGRRPSCRSRFRQGPGAEAWTARPAGAEVEPERALVGVNNFATGGLADEGEVGALLPDEGAGAFLAGFLAHEPGEPDLVAEGGDAVAKLAEAPEHGGHGAFGVGGAAPPKFAVADFAAEWVDDHAGDADGIEMRGENNAFLAGAIRGESANDIRAAGGDFAQLGFRAAVAKERGDEFGAGLLAGALDAGGAVRD